MAKCKALTGSAVKGLTVTKNLYMHAIQLSILGECSSRIRKFQYTKNSTFHNFLKPKRSAVSSRLQ